jgi:di/tricarboxylate transporter
VIQFSEAMQTEIDFVVDAVLFYIIGVLFLTRDPSNSKLVLEVVKEKVEKKKRKRGDLERIAAYVVISVVIKASYWMDKQQSLNFKPNPSILHISSSIQENFYLQTTLAWIGILMVYVVEHRIVNKEFGL